MQKIKLDTDNERLNQRQVLRQINNSPISRKNMTFNFIKAGDDYWCLFTTHNDERESLPKELQETGISYEKLAEKALS